MSDIAAWSYKTVSEYHHFVHFDIIIDHIIEFLFFIESSFS